MTSQPNGVALMEAFYSSVNILFSFIIFLVLQQWRTQKQSYM